MRSPKLRDKRSKKSIEPYPLGLMPDDLIIAIAKHIVYYAALGQRDTVL